MSSKNGFSYFSKKPLTSLLGIAALISSPHLRAETPQFYHAKPRDTLTEILFEFNLQPIYGEQGSLNALLKLNPEKISTRGNAIRPGEKIYLPTDFKKPRENLALAVPESEVQGNEISSPREPAVTPTLVPSAPAPPTPIVKTETLAEESADSQFYFGTEALFNSLSAQDASSSGSAVINLKSGWGFLAGWKVLWTEDFYTFTEWKSSLMEYGASDNTLKELQNRSLLRHHLSVGAGHSFKEHLKLRYYLGYGQEIFLHGVTSNSVRLNSIPLPRLGAQVDYEFFSKGATAAGAALEAQYLFGKEAEEYRVQSGYRYAGMLTLIQDLTQDLDKARQGRMLSLSLGLRKREQNTSLINQSEEEIFGLFADLISSPRFAMKAFLNVILFIMSFTLLSGCRQPDSSIDSNFFAGVKLSASQSTLTVSDTTVVSGTSITVTLTTKDEKGQIFKSPSALSVVLSAQGGSGYGNFSAVTDHGDGTYTATFRGVSAGTALRFKAQINTTYTVTSSQEVTIIGGAFSLAQSYVTVSSNSLSAGSSVTVTLYALDENNNQMTSGGLPVAFALATGSSSGTFDPVVDHDNGTYTSVFHATTAGSASDIVGSILSQTVTSAVPQITVSPGSPAIASVSSGSSQSGTVATSLISDFVVLIKDNFNNVVPGVTVNWSVAGGGTLTSATSTSNASGLASNHLTLGTSAGTKTVTATIASTTLSTSFTVTANAGTPTSIAVPSGNNQTGTVASALSSPLTAVVYDTYSNVVPNIIIEWAVTAGGGSLSTASSTTGASGTASSTLTLGSIAGINTATATIYGSALSVSFSATGTALTTIASLAWQTSPSSTYTASNSSSMSSFSAKLLDTYGNIIASNNSTTATLSLTTGSSSLSGTLTRTASSGVITFNDIKYTKAEAITLKVTENNSGSAWNISSSVTVSPNTADSSQSSISSSASNLANDNVATMTLTFTLKDAYGNVLPDASVVFASTGTGNTLTQPSGVTNSLGQITGAIKSSVAETKTITMTTPALSTSLNVSFAVPSLSVAAASAVKGTTMTFTVTQSVLAGSDVSFNYATSDGTALAGTHYTTTSGSKTISAGQTSTTFTVSTTDTNTDDTSLTLTATLSGASGSSAVIGTVSATGTITDTTWIYNLTGCSLPAGLTFSRSSSSGSSFDASGVMQVSSSANSPRFDFDPVNHTCLGLLVEPASYNYILYSSDFSNAVWTDSNITKSANLSSPSGLDNNQTAVQLTENASNATHGITQLLINPDSQTTNLNLSIYAKLPASDPRNYLELVVGDSALSNACFSVFNLSTGANTSNTSVGTATVGTGVISAVANGWYRVSIYCNLGSATNARVSFNLMNASSGSDQYTGTGSHSVYLWGPQAEWGNSFPTSYIVNNTNVAKYRAMETLTVNNFLSWFNYTDMTVSVDFARAAIDDAAALQSTFLWRADDGTASNIFMSKISGSGRKTVFYGAKNASTSAAQAQVNLSLPTTNTIYQYVVSYANSGATIYQNINATLSPVGAITSSYVPAAADLNRFAYVANTPTYYRRLVYRGRALASTKLSSLTGAYVASATNSTISATGPTTANGTSNATVTITLKNAANVGMPGFTPAFTASGSGNTVGVCTMTDANGISTCSLSSTVTGTKTIKISAPAGLTTVTNTAVFN